MYPTSSARGYSLAGIRDLLGAGESGTDLTTLLGVGQGQAVLDEATIVNTDQAEHEQRRGIRRV